MELSGRPPNLLLLIAHLRRSWHNDARFSMSKPGNAFDAKRRHQPVFFLRPQLNSFFFSLLHATTMNGLNVALLTNWLLRTAFLIICQSFSSMSFFVVFFLPLSLSPFLQHLMSCCIFLSHRWCYHSLSLTHACHPLSLFHLATFCLSSSLSNESCFLTFRLLSFFYACLSLFSLFLYL